MCVSEFWSRDSAHAHLAFWPNIGLYTISADNTIFFIKAHILYLQVNTIKRLYRDLVNNSRICLTCNQKPTGSHKFSIRSKQKGNYVKTKKRKKEGVSIDFNLSL